jgi:predicted nuclease of restriction endonuclease-like (RecB) superfamily
MTEPLLPRPPQFDGLYVQIRDVLTEARQRTARAINHEMLRCYWEIGRLIVEEEQAGLKRAEYGAEILRVLSRRLKDDFGKGFDRTNLYHMRSLYLTCPKVDALRRQLSWTHYRILLRVEKPEARAFYEAEAVAAGWSTRELERQVHSLLFERLALSQDKKGLMKLVQEGHQIQTPQDLVKDPYVLEFVGIPQKKRVLESDLEQVLIEKLQDFLLELGKGFAFMGQQQRITLDGQHFFIDLVFYNRLTHSFVLFDLKMGPLTHQDLGQMQMYVNYYQRELTQEGENSPIGIVLCTEKNEAVVRFTLPEGNTQIFASRYKLYLPTEEELIREIQCERKKIERKNWLDSEEIQR